MNYCGGDPKNNASPHVAGAAQAGGGGYMSLSQYLYPVDSVTDKLFTSGECLMRALITDRLWTA